MEGKDVPAVDTDECPSTTGHYGAHLYEDQAYLHSGY